jgi:magnesium-transporting ATPase (P-type)
LPTFQRRRRATRAYRATRRRRRTGARWTPTRRCAGSTSTRSAASTPRRWPRGRRGTARTRCPEPPPRPWWRIVARQFASPLIYILFAAAALAVVLGHLGDAGVILAVVVVNALVGSVQEGRAERSMGALRRLAGLRARVLREGREADVEARDLVPGDVLVLSAGDAVGADARLLAVAQLQLAEAALTGESVPVTKATPALPEATGLADRHDMVYAGTHVGRIDPPREEARHAVANCRAAGMRVVMVTGDHKLTGLAIAHELGIARDGDLAVDGSELERMGEADLMQDLPRVAVFARVQPAQKLRIVEPLIDREMLWRVALMTPLIAGLSIGWCAWRVAQGAPIECVRTETFTVLAMCQWFKLLSCQSATRSVLRLGLLRNPWLLGGLALSVALQALVLYAGTMNALFHTVPLPSGAVRPTTC